MGSPSELSLDYKHNTYVMIPKPHGEQPDQTRKLEDFLACLEEERLKIEAFKRELPLCMQLLNNAMETYRQQLETCQTKPRLEEFIPFSNMTINGSEKASTSPSEKASWMVSAQLWSPESDLGAKQQPLTAPLKDNDRLFDTSPKLALDTKQRNGGAFLPFSKEKNKGSGSALRVLPELALAPSEKEVDEKKSSVEMENGGMLARRENGNKVATHEQGNKGGSNSAEGAAAQSTHRKARRCWSPDLHRRFVNALQRLGGSQVATPKQIRELMKVEGLTNDEVKSHLQKYRLHTRRPNPPPQPTATAAPQLVVLGGIWVPPEYATSAAAAGPAIYGTHPAAQHYSVNPQDFYQPPPPPLPPHHHHHHHHFHRSAAAAYKAQLNSPESELRSNGGLSESIEEEEEGDEREDEEEEEVEDIEEEEVGEEMKVDEKKALVPLKAADSNGSDVTVKF